VLRCLASTSQCSQVTSAFSTDDLGHLIHHVQGRLLQRGSCRSTYRSMNGTGCSLSSTRPLGSRHARRYNHVTQLLMDLHWLRVHATMYPVYKLCVLAYGYLNVTAPGYLSDLTVSGGSTTLRQLRSASTSDLVVPQTRRASIGDRAFAVACQRA